MKTHIAIAATLFAFEPAMARPSNMTAVRILAPRNTTIVKSWPGEPRSEASLRNSTVHLPVVKNDALALGSDADVPLEAAIANMAAASPLSPVHFVPRALPQNASADAIKLQPVLDYSKNSCYNVPAIGTNGKMASGLSVSTQTNLSGGCRSREHLQNQNVYVRRRCNNGWCAYMYEHYFEKDVALEHVAGIGKGHRHEWENAVVVAREGDCIPTIVAASAHDGYKTLVTKDYLAQNLRDPRRYKAGNVLLQGGHAKLVYHKDGISTHALRFAKPHDNKVVQNDAHAWVRGALVDWHGFPSTELRDKMVQAFVNTGTEPKISDAHFANYLIKAIGERIPEFDPHHGD